jgi:hypothetical protein|nr:MAG TPA: hypothetical protein [Caudoviricetes sp.]
MTVNKKLICEKMCELLQLTEVGQQIKLKSIDYNPETGEVASSYYSEHFGRDFTSYIDVSEDSGEALIRHIIYDLLGD